MNLLLKSAIMDIISTVTKRKLPHHYSTAPVVQSTPPKPMLEVEGGG